MRKIGIDIIEVNRIKRALADDGFAERVFTENEIKYCNSKNAAKYESFAARFAAKEAIFKSLSDSLENKFEISWKDIEVLNDKNGRPYVNIEMLKNSSKSLKEKDIYIDISLSHIKDTAVAISLAEMKEEK